MSTTKLAARRSVGAQAVMLAGATGIAQLIVALVYIAAARSATPADFGWVVSAIALGTVAVGFVDFGTNSFWVREIARNQLPLNEFSRRGSGKLMAATILAALWLLFSVPVLQGTSYWMAAPVFLSLLLNQTAQVSLRGMARGELVAWSILADRIVVAIVLAIVSATGANAAQFLWLALTAGSVVAAGMGWWMTPAHSRPGPRLWRRTNPWKGSGYYGLSTVAISAQGIDVMIIGGFGGPAAAGLYGAVNRWTQPMSLLAGAFSSASVPFVAHSQTWRLAWPHLRSGIWLLGVAVSICIGVAIGAPWIVEMLIGPRYAGAAPVLQVLALGTIPAIFNQPLSGFLQSLGHDRIVSLITVAAVVFQLALVALSARFLGALGAAIAFSVLQILILAGLTAAAIVTGRPGYRRR
ncbi:hypothetical protein E3T26_02080 [Cryobacterium sp. TMT1-21]|uniref:oligosaccharide flippase family protein n=1 Tax=Cryobacterium sp. TMT1-21 TaxID=1259234 RepID=UPI00106995D2|nr:oligosaccharide flippase family protein [Cryobacterium sp. TMT1-21]TFD17437.1 hypothetical protein E3T26_02080 [Cryobacterium sp. TMT1-21]